MYINGEYWEIQLVSPNNPMLFGALGSCNDTLKIIFINNELNDTKMRKVLCHEVAHAVFFSYNVALSRATEELVADLIARYADEIIYNTRRVAAQLKV